MKLFRLGAVFAALMILAACASQPEIPYDRTAAVSNKTIGLLTPAWPSGPSSFLASSVGQSFGLAGALVDASIQDNRESDLKLILTDQRVDANSDFIAALTANLQAKGFTILPVTADAKRGAFLKKYPAPGANNVDSYLDVAVTNYGYLAAGIGASNPYRPWCAATVKLIRASDGAVLMQDHVTYNSWLDVKNVIKLSPDPEYAFTAWSDTKAAPEKTAQGVQVAAKKTADAIGDLLK
jgi:hypothetical protein